jgi:hypothetical protein
MFESQSVEEKKELQLIFELATQQENLRKGLFGRFQEHNDRLRVLETMVLDLAQMLKFYEEKKAG